jgi:hypothetical protein
MEEKKNSMFFDGGAENENNGGVYEHNSEDGGVTRSKRDSAAAAKLRIQQCLGDPLDPISLELTPRTYDEAFSNGWGDSIAAELECLHKHGTWTAV